MTAAVPHLEVVVTSEFGLRFGLSPYAVGILVVLCLALVAWQYWRSRSYISRFEIDQAEIGLGSSKIKLAINDVDRQIAYKIWVELSTRKIGLDIDLEHDVVAEIYDSWHTFFTVTRELIKDVPVSRFRRPDTEKIVKMSIEVLNLGLRPHLTKWQARFRRWYEWQCQQVSFSQTTPQEIQKQFPDYDQLASELANVNKKLIAYREQMYQLVVAK